MADLRKEFKKADRVPAPDLWSEIATREPRRPWVAESGPAWSRAVVAAAALIVAGLALVGLVRAFGGERSQPAGPTPHANDTVLARLRSPR